MLCAAFGLLFSATAGSSEGELPLERSVRGRTLVSDRAPAIILEVVPPFRYAGGHRFVLYGVAEAEQHVFVDADAAGAIRRMYWIQFEHYLPGLGGTYEYESPGRLRIGPLEFVADTRVIPDYAESVGSSRPGSDVARVGELLRSRGLSLPRGAVRARLFHLPDATRRTELMIIYAEAGASSDAPAASARVLAAAARGLTIRAR